MAGLAAARARGRSGGRPSKLGAEQRRTARTLYDERALTVAQIGQVLGVSRTSTYRAFAQDTAAASAAGGPGGRVAWNGLRGVCAVERQFPVPVTVVVPQ